MNKSIDVAMVSTHSSPKAAGQQAGSILEMIAVSTHSSPKAAGTVPTGTGFGVRFQHTAARRRLGPV